MDVIEKIRRLVALMAENGLAELEVEEPELRIRLKTSISAAQQPEGGLQAQVLEEVAAEPTEGREEKPPAKAEDNLLEITSPMVGTFYRSPSDGAEPYVTTGTIVEPDTVVCIIEAMKVMNEMKAGLSGEIVEILLQNAEAVEFGQVLFLARPLEQ